jgi:PTS system cellobiose-specific IIA component
MEGIELICFQIISASGGAKSAYMAAIESAKAGNFEEAEDLIKQGDEFMNQGHEPHAQLVQQEAAGQKPEIGLLLIHSEDQMMGAEQFKALAEQMIDVYKELKAIKGE